MGKYGVYSICKTVIFVVLVVVLQSCSEKAGDDNAYYPYTPVDFTEVTLRDNYWAPRIEINRTVTIPFALEKNEETGRVDNFRKAAGLMDGRYEGRRFNDTDIYKVLEGVAYSLRLHPDSELESYTDELIELVAAAQEEDGYLMAGRTAHPDEPAPGLGDERWIHLQGSHELYNSGHLFEAAVAYHEATGKTNFLDIALKNADLLVDTFGEDKRHDAPGHQVVEMGLARLYTATGNEEYLELAKFFLDQRGKEHASEPYPEDSPFALYNGDFYKQDHTPVKEQSEAWGHAVRATYMYAGMADIAALSGDKEYLRAVDRIWENAVGRKMYLTGGVGSRHGSEAFGEDYELPNASAYCETCAAVGNAFWNHRMFLTHNRAEYIDVMERVMYNGLISGVSLSGDLFFYTNPLEADSDYRRSPWFEVSCCPGNIVRFLPSVPGYVYAMQGNDLYVNLYVQGDVNTGLGGRDFSLSQETDYPWSGDIKLTVNKSTGKEHKILLRIPGWVYNKPAPSDLYYYRDPGDSNWSIEVNGEKYEGVIINGYVAVERKWKKGDIIALKLPMEIHQVKAHDKVEAARAKVALQRGPLVWCAEGTDNKHGVFNTFIPADAGFTFMYSSDMPYGTGVIEGMVKDSDGNNVNLTLVPYAYWANREPGNMVVWLNEAE